MTGRPGEFERGQPGLYWKYQRTANKRNVLETGTGKGDREDILGELSFGEIWRGSYDLGCLEREKGILEGQVQSI